jgi:hypothetical protein
LTQCFLLSIIIRVGPGKIYYIININIPHTKYKINLILIINCFNIIKEVTMVTKKKVLSLIVLGLMSCMMISEVGARRGCRQRRVRHHHDSTQEVPSQVAPAH